MRDEAAAYFAALPFSNGLPSWEPYPAAWHTGPEAWPAPNLPATPEQIDAWADEVFADGFYPQAAFVDGMLVGATAMISFELTVPGPVQVPIGGVTGTGVIATHRRRGLLRAMMQAMFDEARGRGELLAGLSASEGSIYGHFGFSPATVRTRWEIERHEAELLESADDGVLELVDAAAARVIWPAVHQVVRRRKVGELSPQADQWAGLSDTAHGADGPMRFLVHRNKAGEADGITNFRLPWSPDLEGTGTLAVESMCAISMEAERMMWRLLLNFDLTRKIVAASRPSDEPLRWMLKNPRAMRVTRQSDNLWLRLLDVPAALEVRGYEATDSLCFRIASDPMCPANQGTWRLETGPDGASCSPTSDSPDLVLELAALASLYLGGMSAANLAAAGRIRTSDPVYVARLSRMFRVDPEPHNSFGF